MGRSKADGSRSKARASSSSSLAASQLQNPVAAGIGFGGFVGSARVDGEHLLQDVGGDSFLHLKRLSKKDPTTKLKALVSLKGLFEGRPAAEVSALLPSWLFEYRRLVQDSSRHVRQATHVAMASFAASVGRGLAPHLKSLMGPWWVAQFDPAREVSEAAKESFQVAFSEQKKRLEALVFCEKEVFIHLDDNLKLTVQTVSDRATPVEEATEKYGRIVSCSLLALAAFIDVLIGSAPRRSDEGNESSDDKETTLNSKARISEDARNLCWSHKFLQQFLKSPAPRVRSAAYEALRSFIQHLPEVFREEDMNPVVPSILGSFTEKDPACHQQMWDMVILFARAFPQAWGTTAIKKTVFPHLFTFLRNGCYGGQQISYPYVVLLISLIAPGAASPAQNFLLNLFSNLWQGQNASQLGLADYSALLKAVQECLIWTVLNAKRFSDAEGYEAVQLQLALIDGVFVNLMWPDYIGGSNKFQQQLGLSMARTIQLLSGHVDEIMDNFWNEFQELCSQIIIEAGSQWQTDPEEDPRISRMAYFFVLLGKQTSESENRDQWSLTRAVRPFVAKSFPAIKSRGQPGSIRLVANLITIYGPSVFSLLSGSESQKDEGRQAQGLEDYEALLEFFRIDIVPWCLAVNDSLSGPKAELVLAFVGNDKFQQEWEFVVSHVTGWLEEKDNTIDFSQVEVLATLLEKARERENSQSTENAKAIVIRVDGWKSQRIERAAVRVASSHHFSHPSCLRFLTIVLGGATSERTFLPIVSNEAALQILNSVLLRMLSVLSASSIKWERSAPSSISGDGDLMNLSQHEEADQILQLAVSAVNVLENCIFSVLILDRDQRIIGKLVAAIFCLKWACSRLDDTAYDDGWDSSTESETDSEDELLIDGSSAPEDSYKSTEVSSGNLEVEPSSKLELGWSRLRESVQSIWDKTTPQFFRGFSVPTRSGLRQVLIECLRVAVLDEEFEAPQHMARRCAGWAQEVVGYACETPDEVSEFLDLLLASADSWPLWAVAPSPKSNFTQRYLPSWNVQQNVDDWKLQRHDRFVAFVDQLCRALGLHEMSFGSLIQLGVEIHGEGNGEDDLPDKLDLQISGESSRIWLVVELLCSWRWPGGSALSQVLPYLFSLARSPDGSIEFGLLWGTIQGLFVGSSDSSVSGMGKKEPFLRALLALLQGLLQKEDRWSTSEARSLFQLYVTNQEDVDFVSPLCNVQILPHVLAVLMPFLRKRGTESAEVTCDEEWHLQTAVSLWLQKAMTWPPLVALTTDSEISGTQWVHVAVACFPLNPAGGAAAMASASSVPVTSQEQELLLALFRKQYSYEAIRAQIGIATAERLSLDEIVDRAEKKPEVEVTLAKLASAAVGYCWLSFDTADWDFILKKLRGWVQQAVTEAEEFAEGVVDAVEAPQVPEPNDADSLMKALENVVAVKGIRSIELYSTAVAIFSLVRGLSSLVDRVDSTDVMAKLKEANWETVEMRVLEDVLRLLLSIGLAESGTAFTIAGENGAKLIASGREVQSQLWDNVADIAIDASSHARQAAIRAVDLWGVGKGAISSLYALLLSPQPTTSLQWVAYEFLSTREILPMAISYGIIEAPVETESAPTDEATEGAEVKEEDVKVEAKSQGLQPAQIAQIRPELASTLEKTSLVLQCPLKSSLRVSYLISWSLLLTHLQSLTALSRRRELLVQYIQDSDTSPALLDCLFQYIPLGQKPGSSGSRRRKPESARVTMSSAAASATRAAATGSVLFAIKGLWPVEKESVVTLAGAMYGLMVLVLPACVRIWFTGLRDKSFQSAVEAFTETHCSPQLLADEFAQVQAATVNEENLSIRANRTLGEVVAIYQKEEAGMDIVIKMPACYPLKIVDVECTKRLGINETLLRKWILSMTAFLRNQNGAVAEAIQMWKKNVDREFEGVEECPICYSIIHTSNNSLPRLACKTCRHKFHSACLYKWFSTSHQSTCPLCKSPF